METALLYLIFNITAILLAHVAQHLREYPLQRIVAHHTTTGTFRILHRLVAVIADIESGAIEMTRILRSITITPTELHDILLGAEHAGDDDLMQGHTLHVETIEERLPNILQQHGCTRYEIGNARIKRIDVVIRVGSHINKFTFAHLSISTVLNRRDAPTIGGRQLQAIGIRKGFMVIRHGTNLVTQRFPLGNGQFGLPHRRNGRRARMNTGFGHLRKGPPDARKEQNDGYKT